MSFFKVQAQFNGRTKMVEVPRRNLSLFAIETAVAQSLGAVGVSLKYTNKLGAEQSLYQDFHLDAALQDTEERGAHNLVVTVVATSSAPSASTASPNTSSPYRAAGAVQVSAAQPTAARAAAASPARSAPVTPAADISVSRLPPAKKSAPTTRSSHTSSPVLSTPTTMGRLAASLVDGSQAPATPPVQAKFCPSCGTPASGGKFCMECGSPLGTTPAASPAASPAKHPSVLSPAATSPSKPNLSDSIAKKLAAEERKKKRFSAPYPAGNPSANKNACGACGNHLGLSSVSALGKSWHKECFCCQFCNKSLVSSGFKAHNEQPSCPDCYNDRFGPKCFGCAKTIASQYVEIHDKMFHIDCFVCKRCQQSLQNGCTLTVEGYLCRSCA